MPPAVATKLPSSKKRKTEVFASDQAKKQKKQNTKMAASTGPKAGSGAPPQTMKTKKLKTGGAGSQYR